LKHPQIKEHIMTENVFKLPAAKASSKTERIIERLLTPAGITVAEAKQMSGWPAISFADMATRHHILLRKIREGTTVRFFGTRRQINVIEQKSGGDMEVHKLIAQIRSHVDRLEQVISHRENAERKLFDALKAKYEGK
jgi:hypothetical protein